MWDLLIVLWLRLEFGLAALGAWYLNHFPGLPRKSEALVLTTILHISCSIFIFPLPVPFSIFFLSPKPKGRLPFVHLESLPSLTLCALTLESRCNEVGVCSPTLHYTGLLDSATPFELHFAVILAWSHALDLQCILASQVCRLAICECGGGGERGCVFLFCFHLLLVILYNHDQIWPQQSWPVPLCGQFRTSREREKEK